MSPLDFAPHPVCAAFSGVWQVTDDARRYVIQHLKHRMERDR